MNRSPYAHLLRRQQAYCLAVAWGAAAPRRTLTVSEWADAHRELTGKQSGERGRYRTSRTPFWREVADCLSSASRASDVVIMCSSQIGKTEFSVNVIGYTMHHHPVPMMVLMPTLEARDKWKAQKLNPLLTDTPAIRDLLGGLRSRDAANSKDMIDFPGGILFLAGGNSPNSYAQSSVAILIMDDLDRFPAEIGAEGDPVELAKGRTKAFPRHKHVFISTPTTTDTSLIHREWLASDRRHYFVPCPHCGGYQPLEWGAQDAWGVKWNESLTEAWYVCRECGAQMEEHHKPKMLAAGRWIAEAPEIHTRGYHLSALYSPIGLGPSWLDLARGWKAAVGNITKLKTFVNTMLGEPWTEAGDSVEPVGLLARLENYPEVLPRCARTLGVDVQKDRIEYSVVDFGVGEEAWLREHCIIAGDTARPEVWDTLADEIRPWAPDAMAVDSGYNASMVYAFCERREVRGFAYVVKGRPGSSQPIVEDAKKRLQRLRGQRKKGITVHMVGDDQAKALIYARLKLREPGPGYIHFPADPCCDDEYFAQLTAEKLVTKLRGTRPYSEWVQTRPRNETLDCFKYALAALRLSGKKTDVLPAAMQTPALLKPATTAPAARPGWKANQW